MSEVLVDWIVVGGPHRPWSDLGLHGVVDGERLRLPFFGTGIEVDADRPVGVQALALSRPGADSHDSPRDIDGIPVEWRQRGVPLFADHVLGVEQLDHVVITTDDLARTCGAVADVTGAPLKRVREVDTMRQGFHRCGTLIIEVVERADAPVTVWGLVLSVTDLDGAVRHIGPDRIGPAQDAVQSGRRIATLRRDAGLGCAVALMSPHRS